MARLSGSGYSRSSHQLFITLGFIYVLLVSSLPTGGADAFRSHERNFSANPDAAPARAVGATDGRATHVDSRMHWYDFDGAQRGCSAGCGCAAFRVGSTYSPCGSLELPYADCNPGMGWMPPANDPNLGTARTLPQNDTGTPGVDLGSRNYNWSLPIVNLPGRAGMNLGLTLAYNSLVWIKQGDGIMFNPDRGFPGAGFQLGLPRIEPPSTNLDGGGDGFILIMPSGGRIRLEPAPELNDYPASVYYGYKSGDSEYVKAAVHYAANSQLDAFYVWLPDGTKLDFTPQYLNGSNRCTRITDRNGNFISDAYDSQTGHLTSLTDTVGRGVDAGLRRHGQSHLHQAE